MSRSIAPTTAVVSVVDVGDLAFVNNGPLFVSSVMPRVALFLDERTTNYNMVSRPPRAYQWL